MFRASFALLVFVGTAGPSLAASPDPKTLTISPRELSRSRDLVKQLGSESFPDRERAEEALGKMGRLARPALLEAVTGDPDPEIRVRCSTLLPKATAQEMKARLEVFLADVEGQYEHDLPGWNQFRSVVRNDWTLFGYPIWSDRGLDKAARTVFVDLISTPANRNLVMATAGPHDDLGQIVANRRQELYTRRFPRPVGGAIGTPIVRRDPTAEDVAALLFGESLVPTRVPVRTVSISILINAPGFRSQIQNNDDKGKVYRAIAIAWLESRRDPIETYQAMTLANNLGLRQQSLRLAVRLFTTPGIQVFYRGNAAAVIAQFGNKEHLPLLEKSLQDATVLTAIRPAVPGKPPLEWPTYDGQIRDVALAVSLQLTGQRLDDYGFVDSFRANGGVPRGSYNYAQHYLPEAKRKAAFAKWKAYRENDK